MGDARWMLAVLIACCAAPGTGQDVPETVTLRVTVTDDAGQPVADADVTLSGHGDGTQKWLTGADGAVDIGRVRPGEYSLRIAARGFVWIDGRRVVVSGAEPTTHRSCQLTPGCQVFGRMRVELDLPPATDRAWIRRLREGVYERSVPLNMRPDGSFACTIKDFGPARWAARVEGYDWTAIEIDPQPGGLFDGLEFALDTPSGSVSGRVVDQRGDGVGGAFVALIREDVANAEASEVWEDWPLENASDRSHTLADGLFAFDDIPPGRYYIGAATRDQREYRGHTGPLEVRPGQRTDNVRVTYDRSSEPRRVTVVGTLYGLDGAPRSGSQFILGAHTHTHVRHGTAVTTKSAHELASDVRSDAAGRFTILTRRACHRASIGIWGAGSEPARMLLVGLDPDENGRIDIDTAPTRQLTGIAYRGSADEPLANTRLRVHSSTPGHTEDAYILNVYTDASGRFGPIRMDTDRRVLRFARHTGSNLWEHIVTLDVAAGEDPTAVEVAFPGVGSIEGSLSFGGAPVDVAVKLIGLQDTRIDDSGRLSSHTGQTIIVPMDERGWRFDIWRTTIVPAGQTEWRFDDLEAGPYAIWVEGTNLALPPQLSPCEVRAGKAARCEINVPRGVPARGRVVAEDGSELDRLQLWGRVGNGTAGVFHPLPVQLDGTFAIHNMSIGPVSLRASAQGYNETYCDIAVPDGGIEDLQLRMPPP